ncbi:MAG: DUF3987 domain-containing protein [Desulfovibrionaceae bacterium]
MGAESAFRGILEASGLVPGEVVADGVLRRCGTTSKPHSTNGWHRLYGDAPISGSFGDWKAGTVETWTERPEHDLSPVERQALRARVERDRAAREAEEFALHTEAAAKAQGILGKTTPCTSHPYLMEKGVKPCPGLRVSRNTLVVPVQSEAGGMQSLQFIAEGGGKRFLHGGRTKGGFFLIEGNGGRLYLCEGLATGLSVHEATGERVLVAFNAGNIGIVAQIARRKYPNLEIVIVADNDHATMGNPGVTKATEAAHAFGGLLAVPNFQEAHGQDGKARTDFNDLHQAEGLDVVRAQLAGATKPEAVTAMGNPVVPVAFDACDVPEIDPAMLPPMLADFCGAVAETLQVPFELVLVNALACIATAAQRKFKIQVRDGYHEPVNIYAMAALPPGERKSATVEACKLPLLEWEEVAQEEAREHIRNAVSERKTLEKAIEGKRSKAAHAKSAEDRRAIINEVKALEAELPEIPASPRLLLDDATPEAIPAFLEHHDERAGIIEAEGGLLDILAGRYSKGVPNLDAVLKMWSGEAVHVDRKGGAPIVLHDPALTICLSPQPEIIKGMADKPGFRGRGLVGRFLFLLPKSRVGNRAVDPKPMPPAIRAQYDAKVRGLLSLPWATGPDGKPTPYILRLEPKAYSDWLNFHRDVEAALRPGGELELIADWGGKLHGEAVRLAGLLHLAGQDSPHVVPISAETMRQALGLAGVLVEHAKTAFALMGAHADIECAKHILAWIVDRRIETFQARDALNQVKGRYPKMDAVKAGLAVLEERGFIFPVSFAGREPGKAGRPPSQAYRVNPLAFGGAA